MPTSRHTVCISIELDGGGGLREGVNYHKGIHGNSLEEKSYRDIKIHI